MPDLPSFVRSFQKKFNRALGPFIVVQERTIRQLDPRMVPTLRRATRTLAGGKRLRPLLVHLGYEAAGGNEPATVLPAGLSVELFHSFALTHDDIIDRALLRRGQPTIQTAVSRDARNPHVGLTAALLNGDLLLSLADQFDQIRLPARRIVAARKAFQRMTTETILGEQLEFDLARSNSVSLEDTLRIMMYKSGRYSVEWPLTIGALLAGAPTRTLKSLSRFSIPLGLAFQLRDDILGVFGNPSVTGKSRDSDLREGKPTLLAYVTKKTASENGRRLFDRALGNPNASRADLSRLRALIRASGARQWAEALARDLTDAGLQALHESPIRPTAKTKLERLARYLLERPS